jgi:LacI family transcriptional regulator
MDMVGEISHELARHEIDLLLIADDDLADKHSYMRMVQSRRVDALIVAHTLDHDPRLSSSGRFFLALGAATCRSRTRGLISTTMPVRTGDPLADRERPSAHRAERRKQQSGVYSPSAVRVIWTRCGKPLSSEWLRAMPLRAASGMPPRGTAALPQPPTAIITDCNTHGDGAAMALAQLGRLPATTPSRWWSTTVCRRTASSKPTWRR